MRRRGYRAVERDAALSPFEIAIVLTDHDMIDLDAVAAQVPIVFDTRGAYRRRGLTADNVSTL